MAYHEYEYNGKLVRRHYNGKRFAATEKIRWTVLNTEQGEDEDLFHLKSVKLLNDLQDYLGDELYRKWLAANEPEETDLDYWQRTYWRAREACLRKEAVKEKLNGQSVP